MRATGSPVTALTLLFAALMALAGCNTIEGAGEDIEAAGEAIEGEAEESDDY